MLHNAQLTTPRLTIRPFETTDEAGLVDLFADPQVARFVGDGTALSLHDASLWVANSRANLARFGYGTGAVVESASDRLVGWAGIARPGPGEEELVYGLSQEFWGRGLGSELVSALISFWQRHNRGVPLHATVDPENTVSVHLLAKNGFVLLERSHGGDEHSDLYVLNFPERG